MTLSQISILEHYQALVNVVDEKADKLVKWQEVALEELRRETLAVLSGDRRKFKRAGK